MKTTILCLETATTNCSVALTVNGKVVSVREENSKKHAHAEKLHVFIEEVLHDAQIGKKEIDAIAVSKGPGSYTGLRIGVSAAKGLAFALDVPIITIGTLNVLAQQVKDQVDFIIPLLDARRMEVYGAVFDNNKNQIRDIRAEILTPSSFAEFLGTGKCIFIGDGAAKFRTVSDFNNAAFLPDRYPSAKEMGELALDKYKIGDFDDVAYFEPFYLKEFIPGK